MPLYQNTQKTSLTRIHKRLITLVKEMGLAFRIEEPLPPYFVDVYLTEFNIGLEADGPYHRAKHDRERDAYILSNYQVPILRLKENVLSSNKKKDFAKELIKQFIEQNG